MYAICLENGKILVSIRDNQNIEEFLKGLEKILPASIFLKSAKHYLSETRPDLKEFQTPKVPNSIALCPNCQKGDVLILLSLDTITLLHLW